MSHFIKRVFEIRIISIILCLFLTSALKSQTNSDGSSPQFLFPDFADGSVKMKNGNSQTTYLNYNIISEKMVYEKDGNLYDLVNTEMVDTVLLQGCKFIPVGKIFHEVLLIAPISLFVQYKGDLIPPGTPAGYGGTSQVSNTKRVSSIQLSSGYYNLKLPDDYQVKTDVMYWIKKDSSMYNYMNERQFLKLFPGKEGELKKIVKEKKIKFDKASDMVALVEHCITLLQK